MQVIGYRQPFLTVTTHCDGHPIHHKAAYPPGLTCLLEITLTVCYTHTYQIIPWLRQSCSHCNSNIQQVLGAHLKSKCYPFPLVVQWNVVGNDQYVEGAHHPDIPIRWSTLPPSVLQILTYPKIPGYFLQCTADSDQYVRARILADTPIPQTITYHQATPPSPLSGILFRMAITWLFLPQQSLIKWKQKEGESIKVSPGRDRWNQLHLWTMQLCQEQT